MISFIYLADGVMSYSYPILLETKLSSNTLMGMIMSASCITGLVMDYIFPQLFRAKSWRFFLFYGVLGGITFPIITYFGEISQLIVLFVLGSLLWGIYYEFISFSVQTFVVNEHPKEEYSKTWGIISTFGEIISVITPIVASYLLSKSMLTFTGVVIMFQLVGLIMLSILHVTRKANRIEDSKKERFFDEVKYWFVLGKRTYPLIIKSFSLQLISAAFWVFGGLFGRELAGKEGLDWLVLFTYTVPSILCALIIAKLNIQEHKKRISTITLGVTGIILGFLYFTQQQLVPSLVIIGFVSIGMTFTWLLHEAVASDLQKRLGRNLSHLQGLGNATYQIGYIVSPLALGFMADRLDYNTSFALLGLFTFVISILLLIITPRKIKLPQTDLEQIEASEPDLIPQK